MNEKISSIYENIYNKELEWKNNFDNKFASRLSIFLAVTTASFIIFSAIFFQKNNVKNIILQIFCKVNSIMSVLIWIIQCYHFYKCFFRIKKTYKVMPTIDMRLFHFYINHNDLCGKKEEDEFYDYLNDSYLNCAYTNANVNSSREKSLIIFDNTASISFILLIFTYVLMNFAGYSIMWIF